MKLGKVYYKKPNKRRFKKRFAFFPKVLSDNQKIWWESYYSYQEYQPYGVAWKGNNYDPGSSWVEEYSCTTIKQLKDYLKIEYRRKKDTKNIWNKLLEQL